MTFALIFSMFRFSSRVKRVAGMTLLLVGCQVLCQPEDDQLAEIERLQQEQEELEQELFEMAMLELDQHQAFESTMYASTSDVPWHTDTNQCAVPLELLNVDKPIETSAISSKRSSASLASNDSNIKQSGSVQAADSPLLKDLELPTNYDGYVYNRTFDDSLQIQHPSFANSALDQFERLEMAHVPFALSLDRHGAVSAFELTNQSLETATASLILIDDVGNMYRTMQVEFDPLQTKMVTTTDLESGSSELGITGVGRGIGDWRVLLHSDLPFSVDHQVQFPDGTKQSFNGNVPVYDDIHHVAGFAPSSYTTHQSLLRLVNRSNDIATIQIDSTDQSGLSSGAVTVRLAQKSSMLLRANELEQGSHAFEGKLGQVDLSRNLQIRSESNIVVQHIFEYGDQALANVSASDISSLVNRALLPLFFNRDGSFRTHGYVEYHNPRRTKSELEIEILDLAGNQLAQYETTIDPFGSYSFSGEDLLLGNESMGLSRIEENPQSTIYVRSKSDTVIFTRAFSVSEIGWPTPVHARLQTSQGSSAELLFEESVGPLVDFDQWHLSNNSESLARVALSFSNGDSKTLVLEPSATTVVTRQDVGSIESDSSNVVDNVFSVQSDQPLIARYFVDFGDGVRNLTPANDIAEMPKVSNEEEVTPRQHFSDRIYAQILRARCMNCHIPRGASQNTRLVFVSTSEDDHEEKNYQILKSFFEDINDGPNYLLSKVRGQGHGGGRQFGPNSTQYMDLERLIELLEEERNRPPPPPPLTAEVLFDHVQLEPERRTLWKAALIMAGRTPTEAEYASLDGTDDSLRSAIRSLLVGDGFKSFLRRAANDRLLTNRDRRLLNRKDGLYATYTNQLQELYAESGEETYIPRFWDAKVQYGVRAEPLELIVHVATNDLPYTEILTADYVMANPFTNEVYGAETEFEDSTNHREFSQAQVLDYFRRCGGFRTENTSSGLRVTDTGSCRTKLPQAGLLTSKAFLQRYPTSTSNRNRARSRWTYYHFLGEDIENATERIVDSETLADANVPTFTNPHCTVCHERLDPVAGTFQDYGNQGLFQSSPGGLDSLNNRYRRRPYDKEDFRPIQAASFEDRQVVQTTQHLVTKDIGLLVGVEMDPDSKPKDDADYWSVLGIDQVEVKTSDGRVVDLIEVESLDIHETTPGVDLLASEGEAYGLGLRSGRELIIPITLPSEGSFTFDISVWSHESSEAGAGNAHLRVIPEYFYREGDKWFRDMRKPGFNEMSADETSPLQWLAQQIVADERFALGSVRFWWPAIFGNSIQTDPTNDALPNFEYLKLGFEAQQAEVIRLANAWRDGFDSSEPFILRDLLTELAMSPWFRIEKIADDAPEGVVSALSISGSNRLLTPEELAVKTEHVTGLKWRASAAYKSHLRAEDYETSYLERTSGVRLLYGGIDSNDIADRQTEMSAIMASVAQSHALEMSCPITYRELYLLDDGNRNLLSGIDLWDAPTQTIGQQFSIGLQESETLELDGTISEGSSEISLQYVNDVDSEEISASVHFSQVRLLFREDEVLSLDTFEESTSDTEGACIQRGNELSFLCNDLVRFPVDLTRTGGYKLEVTVRGEGPNDYQPKINVTMRSLEVPDQSAEAKLKQKLVALHGELLGREVSTDSTEIENRFSLLKDTFDKVNARSSTNFNNGERCDYWAGDYRYIRGIAEQPVSMVEDKRGGHRQQVNKEAMSMLWTEQGSGDPTGMANAWSMVIASYLLDYEYLHF